MGRFAGLRSRLGGIKGRVKGGFARLRDRSGKFAYTGGKKRGLGADGVKGKFRKFRAKQAVSEFASGVGKKARTAAAKNPFNNQRTRLRAQQFATKAKGYGAAIPRAFKSAGTKFSKATTRRYGSFYGSATGAAKYYARKVGNIQISKTTARLIQGTVGITAAYAGYRAGEALKEYANSRRKKRRS